MHELSIAQAVVDVALRHAGDRRVTKVELKVGHLRQVVPSALEFAFELVAAGTVLEHAELAIEDVRARGHCRACGVETVMEAFPLQCSRCGDLNLELLAGDELLVDSLEVETESAELAGQATTTGGIA
jgi:hydrogenase nickel incorporation protein HypA/HybF